MMLDPLRVKNHLEPVRIFRSNFSTAVPFFRLWLIEASRSIIKLPISFFEFSQSSDSESDEIIFAWVWLKTTVNFIRKDFYGVYSGDIRSFIQVLELFSFFFFFYHTEERWLDRSLSESVVICHGLVLTVTPYVFERLSKWTVHGWTVRGWMSRNINFDRFLSIIWWFHLWIMVSSFLTGL